MKEKEWVRATRRTDVAGGGAGAKMATTEAVVEATAVTGGVDTGAATTAGTAAMVTATAMTRLNVCDASTEASVESVTDARNNEIDERVRTERVGKRWRGLRSVAPALARILRRRRGSTRWRTKATIDKHTIKQNMVELGGRWRRK